MATGNVIVEQQCLWRHQVCVLFYSCWECTLALYCSEACRQESWDQYHQWECHGGLELLHSIGIAHLGLRVVLKAGSLHTLRDFVMKLQESGSQLQDTYGDKQYNYKAVYQLVSHLEDMKREDLFQYTMVQLLEGHLIYCMLWNHDLWQVIIVYEHSIIDKTPTHALFIQHYRVSQEECAILRESVPYVKLYRYNPKHLCPKLNSYGDNGQRSLKLWQLLHTYWLPNTY